MPWCNTCDHFLSPSSVKADGTCPRCGGHDVDPGKARAATTEEEPLPPVPWSLRILAVAAAIYLLFRFVQMIGWLL